jgi:hypothetical protein
MRKNTLVFIFAITALMHYTGCGEDDDGGAGAGAPAAPAALSPECEECPCKFFDVPMNDGCWPSPSFVLRIPSDYFTCSLQNVSDSGARLFTEAPGPVDTRSQIGCTITPPTNQDPGCDIVEVRHVFTNEERNNNVTFFCRTCMNQYISDLINKAMIPVNFPQESECSVSF